MSNGTFWSYRYVRIVWPMCLFWIASICHLPLVNITSLAPHTFAHFSLLFIINFCAVNRNELKLPVYYVRNRTNQLSELIRLKAFFFRSGGTHITDQPKRPKQLHNAQIAGKMLRDNNKVLSARKRTRKIYNKRAKSLSLFFFFFFVLFFCILLFAYNNNYNFVFFSLEWMVDGRKLMITLLGRFVRGRQFTKLVTDNQRPLIFFSS